MGIIAILKKIANTRISYIPNNFNIMDTKNRSFKDYKFRQLNIIHKNYTYNRTLFLITIKYLFF